jgi:peroxiredoxin
MIFLKNIFRGAVLVGALALVQGLQAQTAKRTITGIVTSPQGAPVENASVWVKGTKNNSGTQADGTYYLSLSPADSVLVVATDAYEKQEVRITKASKYNIRLRSKAPLPVFGKWRGVFHITDSVDVPFNFEVVGSRIENAKVYFINGEERFESGSIRQVGDSIFIQLAPFDNELAFLVKGPVLEGVLRRQDLSGKPIRITTERGTRRFTDNGQAPSTNLSGTYAVTFKNEKGADEKAVGLFVQTGNHLKATFLRITGDSRYLDGVVDGNRFYLSSFIGSMPVYYTGSVAANGSIEGAIVSARGKQVFEAVPDDNAALPDAYQLTFLKEGYKTLDFSFPDIDGKIISLKDKKYTNKVVLVTIGGTWCPNCIDEAAFLAPWYKANKDRGIEVIAIHYERQTDSAFLRKAFQRFHQKFDIRYDEVIGGIASKENVAASLPALNTFLSFPTTIFIDKKGNVSKIHTGYTGPATGTYYSQFVKDFNAAVDKLVKE